MSRNETLKAEIANKPRDRRGFLSRFGRDRKGVTAVEFALLATPFFLLLSVIIEVTIVLFAALTLENGLSDTGRLIRTGQVQAAEMDEADFRDALCQEINILLSCGDELRLDIRTFDSFDNVNFSEPLNEDGTFRDDMTFNPGVPGDIVLVRAFYSWPVLTPASFALENMADGNYMVSAAFAFRNEPFDSILPIAGQ